MKNHKWGGIQNNNEKYFFQLSGGPFADIYEGVIGRHPFLVSQRNCKTSARRVKAKRVKDVDHGIVQLQVSNYILYLIPVIGYAIRMSITRT